MRTLARGDHEPGGGLVLEKPDELLGLRRCEKFVVVVDDEPLGLGAFKPLGERRRDSPVGALGVSVSR